MHGAPPGPSRHSRYPAGPLPLSVRAVRFSLESRLTPIQVLRAARSDPYPVAMLGRWAGGGALIGSDPLAVPGAHEDPFAIVDIQPGVFDAQPDTVAGGWIGYLGYGLGSLVEPSAPVVPRAGAFPGAGAFPRSMLGFYDHLIRHDGTGWFFESLWSQEQAPRLRARLARWRQRLAEPPAEPTAYRAGSFSWHPRPPAHLLAVARTIEHIRSGDVYQVNVCGSLQGDFHGDPLEAWCTGAERLRPAYGAYLSYPGFAVASFSPELFLRRSGSHVLTSPIKGTADAGDPRLATSPKDRAENVMIVDLMRNDLGRVCRFGSVTVTGLCRVESHPGVSHLVSDITGELRSGVGHGDLLRATFPPGSVTGAPKVAAMEFIAAVESEPRDVYTGCIGIASPVSGLELNVAIRTLEISDGRARLGAGGGIVADSDPTSELAECLAKVAPLVAAIDGRLDHPPTALPERSPGPARPRSAAPSPPERRPDPALGVFETLLVLDARPIGLEAHLARLATSVAVLYGARLPPSLGTGILDAAAGRSGPCRLRILATPVGGSGLEIDLCFETAPRVLGPLPGSATGLVAVELAGGLGEHKLADRRILTELRLQVGGLPDTQLLLVEPDATVLEAERANVFATYGAGLRTPPADGRILAGTTRELVLHLASRAGMDVLERAFKLDELTCADEVFLSSSVSGVLPVGWLGTPNGDGPDVRTWRAPGPRTADLARRLWDARPPSVRTVGTVKTEKGLDAQRQSLKPGHRPHRQ